MHALDALVARMHAQSPSAAIFRIFGQAKRSVSSSSCSTGNANGAVSSQYDPFAQPPEGRVFLLATREELEAASWRDWDGAVYADGEIYIFDFDSAADLRGALGA